MGRGTNPRRSKFVSCIKRNVQELGASDFLAISMSLKDEKIATLELFISHADLKTISKKATHRFPFLENRHSETMFSFSRALAWSLSTGGWLQRLELGFYLCQRNLQLLVHALCLSKTLKYLSFANSGLGDSNLQLLARGFRDCAPLEVLSLAGCNLTDYAAPLLASILKANVSRKVQTDWQNSLREYKQSKNQNIKTGGPRSGLRALDLSWNKLSDVSTREMCSIFRLGPSIEALNLKGNRVKLESRKMFQDVMKEWGILKFVDLRENKDQTFLGVLEDGDHLRTPFGKQTGEIAKAGDANYRVAHNKITCTGRKSHNSSERHSLWRQNELRIKGSLSEESDCQEQWHVEDGPDRASFGSISGSFLVRGQLSDTDILNAPSARSSFKPHSPSRGTLREYSKPEACMEAKVNYSSCEDINSESPQSSSSARENVRQSLDSAIEKRLGCMSKKNDTEWNGFLADISKSLLQLNDRLDKLIGPSGPSDEITSQLVSKLRVLCNV